MKTESELLFEALCSLCDLPAERLVEAGTKGNPTPDYSIRGHLNRSIVAEIKQFDPNDEELEALERVKAGRVGTVGTEPGKRIRSVINPAGRQLKARSRGQLPALLVLFNNTGCSLHTKPHAVLTAMRGLDVVPVEVPADPQIPPKFLPMRPGPKKKLTADCNTSISAIAVLHDTDDGPQLIVFHNRFAAVPLSEREMTHDRILHFQMSPDQQDWELISRGATA